MNDSEIVDYWRKRLHEPPVRAPRYLAVFATQMFAVGAGPVNIGPGVLDTATSKFYARPDYSDIDLAATCRWLNGAERVNLETLPD